MIETQLYLSIFYKLIIMTREYNNKIVKSSEGSLEGRAPRWDSLRLSYSRIRPLKRL